LGEIPTICPKIAKISENGRSSFLIMPAQHSNAALNLLKAYLVRACVPINANGLFVCKGTLFAK
jgi:hypothetical protein